MKEIVTARAENARGSVGETPSASGTRFRKRPVVIDAVQFGGSYPEGDLPEWWSIACHKGTITRDGDLDLLYIKTLEGEMTARPGDWIIRGIQGELYPCKPDIFAATYEAVGLYEALPEGPSSARSTTPSPPSEGGDK